MALLKLSTEPTGATTLKEKLSEGEGNTIDKT